MTDSNEVVGSLLKISKSKIEEIKNYPAVLLTNGGGKKYVIISSNVYTKDGEFEHTRCFTSEVNEAVFNAVKSTSPYNLT